MEHKVKVSDVLLGILVVGVGAIWAAAAILGPIALIKFCWGYLV
jgi:hypothetical protein